MVETWDSGSLSAPWLGRTLKKVFNSRRYGRRRTVDGQMRVEMTARIEMDDACAPAAAGAVCDRLTAEIVALDAVPPHWEPAWDMLAVEASEPNAFAERWFLTASRALADPARPIRLIAIWGEQRLVGVLPVTVAPLYGRAPVAHVTNWLHFHSFLGSPLIAAGWEEAFWRAALVALDSAEWAPGFLHIAGMVADGPVAHGLAMAARTRGHAVVHRSRRALLAGGLTSQAYYETHVRKKKRKEIERLRSRLAEQGAVACASLARDGGDLTAWCDAFLALEQAGWKSGAGALANSPATTAFFRDAMRGAHEAGRLDMLRLTLDGRPLAMLINFITPPGSFSFKIAFDEEFARYSPGVLIQLENLKLLDRREVAWMDSCASEDHPMINSLWAERRELVRVSVALGGTQRRLAFAAVRAAERAAAKLRELRS